MKLSFPWLAKGRKNSGRLGIAVGPDGIAFTHLDDQDQLVFYRYEADPGDSRQLLADLVAEQGWQGQSCSLVLHPAYYQLLLVDRPAVAVEEMTQAVRWKVKDLLTYPLDQAAIEAFALPDDAYRGRQHKLYVAALQKSLLQDLVEPLEEAGLNVDCIEVAELALHNVASRLQHVDAGGFAVLQLFAAEGFVSMVEEGQLYLTRRIEQGMDQFLSGGNPQHFLDTLVLELQRSLDFYESQLGKGIITHLYYVPCSEMTAPIVDFLSQQLGLHVDALPLAGVANMGNGQSSSGIAAIGAALGPYRKEASLAAH